MTRYSISNCGANEFAPDYSETRLRGFVEALAIEKESHDRLNAERKSAQADFALISGGFNRSGQVEPAGNRNRRRRRTPGPPLIQVTRTEP